MDAIPSTSTLLLSVVNVLPAPGRRADDIRSRARQRQTDEAVCESSTKVFGELADLAAVAGVLAPVARLEQLKRARKEVYC